MAVGYRLRLAREANGLSQAEAGELIARSQSFVAKCELGRTRVDIDDLWRFSIAYRTSLIELLADFVSRDDLVAAYKSLAL